MLSIDHVHEPARLDRSLDFTPFRYHIFVCCASRRLTNFVWYRGHANILGVRGESVNPQGGVFAVAYGETAPGWGFTRT